MLVFIFLIPQIIKQTIKKKHIPIKDTKLHSKFASGLLERMPIANKEYGLLKFDTKDLSEATKMLKDLAGEILNRK